MVSWVLAGGVALAGVGAGPEPRALDATQQPRRVALVVGVDDYTVDPTLSDLRFAGADAQAMALLLEDNGYEVHRAIGEVSRDALLRQLEEAPARLTSQDLLVFYFAGHAQLQPSADQSELQLLTSESTSGDPWAGLALPDLAAALDAAGPARRVAILDACYSRRTWEQLQSTDRGPVGPVSIPESTRSSAWLYAAAPEQSAQEDAALGHGVFTWYALEALRGAGDLDSNGEVGVLELYHYAGARTAEHTGHAQIPRLTTDRVGWQDLGLTGTPGQVDTGILPWLGLTYPRVQVFVDGALRGPGPLEPGRHTLRVEEGGVLLRESTVVVEAGEPLPVFGARPQPASASPRAAPPKSPPESLGATPAGDRATNTLDEAGPLRISPSRTLRASTGVFVGRIGGGFVGAEASVLSMPEDERGAAVGATLAVGAGWGLSMVVGPQLLVVAREAPVVGRVSAGVGVLDGGFGAHATALGGFRLRRPNKGLHAVMVGVDLAASQQAWSPIGLTTRWQTVF